MRPSFIFTQPWLSKYMHMSVEGISYRWHIVAKTCSHRACVFCCDLGHRVCIRCWSLLRGGLRESFSPARARVCVGRSLSYLATLTLALWTLHRAKMADVGEISDEEKVLPLITRSLGGFPCAFCWAGGSRTARRSPLSAEGIPERAVSAGAS